MRCRNSPADSELRVPGTPDSTGLESRPPAWLHDKQHKIPRSSAEKWRQLRPPASRVRQDREQAIRPALRIQSMRNVDCMKYHDCGLLRHPTAALQDYVVKKAAFWGGIEAST